MRDWTTTTTAHAGSARRAMGAPFLLCGALALALGACTDSEGRSKQEGADTDSGADAAPVLPPAGVPTLFYLDAIASTVSTIDPSGGSPQILIDSGLSFPDGIAVDVEAGQLYLTNMGLFFSEDGFVLRADLDGSNVTTLVDRGATYTPKQLVLDEQDNKLYWSDREGMRVQRANLDGTDLETLITIGTTSEDRADEANHAVGIAVDHRSGHFYWTQKGPPDGGRGSIWRAGIETPKGDSPDARGDLELLFDELPEPIDLEIHGEYLYWTDRGDDTVNRAPLKPPNSFKPASRGDREVLVTDISEAIGLAIDPRGERLYYGGFSGQLGHAKLDGSDPVELLSGAGSLTGLAFAELPE